MEAGMSRLSTNSALEATRMKLALLDADVRHLLLPRKCCCSESSTHETAFLEMARYNAWANVRLYKMAGALPEELYRREIVIFIQFVLWHIRCGKSKCHDRKDPLATRSHLSYCCKLCSLDGHCHTTVKILHPFEGNSPTADTLLHLARGRMRFQLRRTGASLRSPVFRFGDNESSRGNASSTPLAFTVCEWNKRAMGEKTQGGFVG